MEQTVENNSSSSKKPSDDTHQPDATDDELIEFIANQSDAFFKSQQRDEEDLALTEKRSIVTDLLQTNRPLFLHRYGKYLKESHIGHIESLPRDDTHDDITVQIDELRAKNRRKQSAVKNRRYNALQKMLRDGSDYFSNSEMQSRDPYLFEQMIGQYMNEKQRKELQESSYRLNYDNANFSSFLMEQIRTVHLNCRYMVGEHVNEQEEEEDDDDDDDDDDEDDSEHETQAEPTDTDLTSTTDKKPKITPESKQQLKEEFRSQMMENFLLGKDKDFFDYSTVDDNEDYDISAEFERDAEDRYFEED